MLAGLDSNGFEVSNALVVANGLEVEEFDKSKGFNLLLPFKHLLLHFRQHLVTQKYHCI